MVIPVTQKVFDQIEASRDSAECNMFHIPCVLRWLNKHNYHEAVIWVHDNKNDFLDGCLKGFEVE